MCILGRALHWHAIWAAECSRHGEINQPLLPVDLVHDELDLVAEFEFAFGLPADEGRAGAVEDQRALRLTGASVAAYVVAGQFLQDTVPVIAALTALLVVEVTLFDIVTSGVQRVVSVVVGVLLAVGFSALVGISWWSLGLLVARRGTLQSAIPFGPFMLAGTAAAMLLIPAA